MSMFLSEIRNVILLFSNPSWKGVGTISSTVIRNVTALSSDMAYSARFVGNTTVLSSRYAAEGVISGLLYVPDLPWGHGCTLESAPHVPLSVTRQANLPPTNYHLIALAPWVNGRCASAYLAAARSAPVRAFLFYIPGNASAPPPPARSSEWHIHGHAGWMSETGYPVFGVSGMAGEVMMQHLSLYSGNLTEVPYGDDITERFLSDPEDYVRIWTELVIGTSPVAFATWVYVLIILGVLLIVSTATSLLMHSVQAWRRVSLRRRVISGEVNLEAMGIKHLTVPMAHIQRFPLFTYRYEPKTNSPPSSPRSVKSGRTRPRKTRSLSRTESATANRVTRSATISEVGLGRPNAAASTTATDYQPTCEICLEPYQNRETVIRELPCGHIFHPECIDAFLHEVSSLCPICKASMLPPGYCPRVTNDMVRRERAIRRLRGRIDVQDDDNEGPSPGKTAQEGWVASTKSRFFGSSKSGPLSSTSTELQETKSKAAKKRPPQDIRIQLRPSRPETSPPEGDVASPAEGATRALARERMRELAGFEPEDGDGMTRWQRMRIKIFPGFH